MSEKVSQKSAQEALQRAKRVAETTYSVVGIVEEFNISLGVMEAYLPGGQPSCHPVTNPESCKTAEAIESIFIYDTKLPLARLVFWCNRSGWQGGGQE